jgi:5-formyltetrahydrofolate cyclo-ligase
MKRDFFSDPHEAKKTVREIVRTRLREMEHSTRSMASLEICRLAAQLPAFANGTCIGLFAPLPSEPDVHLLVEEAWARGKQVALPRMLKEHEHPKLEWHRVTQWGEVVEPGPFGLREPDPAVCPLVEPEELSCVFVPGLAFDVEGNRLGRGGGYYDYFLSHAPAGLYRCGLMFACQQVVDVPHEPHDQKLPQVITEKGLVVF